MGAHSNRRRGDRRSDLVRDRNSLTWGDWAFVFVMTIVAGAGGYALIVFLFDRLW